MSWQDILLTFGQLFFFVALLPSIIGADKPALWTSLMTGGVLSIFVFTFLTLDLVFSGAATALVAAGWYVLAYQKWRKISDENAARYRADF